MEKNKVSVIMPLYNQEAFVSEAIESVLSQTYQDFELIIIDDGSTDKSFEIANSYAEKHRKQISILKHSINKGIGPTRDSGVRNSKGELIAFLSTDDIWKPNFLEMMYNNLKEGIIFCNYEVIQENGGYLRTEKVMPEDSVYTYPIDIFQKLVKSAAFGMFVNYSCILGERKYFEGELKFGDFKFGEDLHHLLKVCGKAPFTYLPEALVKYRWHKNNTTHKVNIGENK